MSLHTAVRGRDHAAITSSMSSRQMIPEYHVMDGIGMSSWADQGEDLYERDLKNRDALMRAREEALRLREEMVLLKESHSRKILQQSNRRGMKAVESSDEDPPPPPSRSLKSSK